MTEVSRHRRKTASGKTTTVRQHTRNTGGSGSPAERLRPASGGPAPYVGDMASAEPHPAGDVFDDEPRDDGDWWADGSEADMTDWSGTPAAPDVTAGKQARRTRPSSEHSDIERRMFGTDTPEGAAAFDRGTELRETHGWSGSMDRTGRIPDPDNPANAWFIGTMKPADVQAMRDKRTELPAEFQGE